MSIVSVSRSAAPPHFGHSTFTQSVAAASGDTPFGARSAPRRSGSTTGSVLLRHRHLAAGRAVDDRDRRAPEPLPGQQPVAQPVVHRRGAQALLRQDLDNRGDRLGLGQPVQRPGVDQDAVARCRDPGGRRVGAVGGDHHPHRQPEPPGEVQVALVVRGHRHDRAGAVVGQHVVGRPDRDALAVHRVDRVHAQEHAGLLPVGRLPLDVGQLPHLRQVRLELGPLGVGAQVGGQRRVRRDDEERRAVQRVGPRGVDGDGLARAPRPRTGRRRRWSGRSSSAAWSAPGRASCPPARRRPPAAGPRTR